MEIKSKFLAILHTNLIKFYPVLLDQKTSIGMCEKISLIVFNILNKFRKACG
jgi:purine-cytosine permease-like protein